MRHDFFRILKGNVKLIHLCACMGVYVSTWGGWGGIMCVWVYCSMSVWGGLRKTALREESMHVKLRSVKVMQLIMAAVTCQYVSCMGAAAE